MDCKGIITEYGEIHIKDNGVMFSNGTISRFDSIGVEDNGEITAEAITGADEITAINYAEITGGNR